MLLLVAIKIQRQAFIMDDISTKKVSLIGKAAPQFVAHSTKGMVDLAAYEGSWVLLFCHPADFTPVCTTEFISLANHQQQFKVGGRVTRLVY